MLVAIGSQAVAGTLQGETYAPAVAVVNMGSIAARGVAGPGGTLQQRFGQLFAERRATVDEFGSNSAMASAYMNSNFANRIWVSPFYNKINVSQTGSQIGSGYDYKAWGVAMGYDRAFGDFMVGAAFTYSRGDYDAKGIRDDVNVDNYGVSLYATYYNPCNGFFGSLFGGYNYGDNDVRIFNAGWDRATPHSDSYWVGGNLGYEFKPTTNFTLAPSIGLTWLDSQSSAYRMHGNRYGTMSEKALLLPVDLAATYTHRLDDCSKIDLTVKGGYAYDFKNDQANGTFINAGGISNPIRGVSPGRHNWNIGAGVKYTRDRFDVGVDYRYDTRKRYDSHFVSATLGIRF